MHPHETWRPGKTNYGVDLDVKSDFVRLGVHVTGIPDAEYPWHMDDVKRIRREFDPGWIPIFRRIVYRSPSGSILVYRHHGIGRFDLNRQPDERLNACTMPTTGIDWPKPNVVDFWFEPEDRSGFAARHGLPAPFQPWGSWVLKMAEEARTLSAREMTKAIREAEDNSLAKKALQAEQEEAAYRARGEARYMKDQLDAVSSSDIAELEARALGYVPDRETKPFVHLGS